MTRAFFSTDMKIERAKYHMRQLQEYLAHFVAASFKVQIEKGEEPDTYRTKLTTMPLPVEVPLIIGDIILNLRSSIDHCYAEAIGGTDSSGYAKFPIQNTREGWIGQAFKNLKKNEKKFKNFGPILFLLAQKVRPWTRPTLLGLNRYANIDKHRILIITSCVAGVKASWEYRGAVFKDNIFLTDAGNDIILMEAPTPVKPENIKPIIVTRFAEPSVKVFHGMELFTALGVMTHEVIKVTSMMKEAV